MTTTYSVETCGKLEEIFRSAKLHRAMRVERYDAGTTLDYHVKTVAGAQQGRVRLVIEKFVGGGFAGQVYRVRLTEIDTPHGDLAKLKAGGIYAMKLLIPASRFSRLFRNGLYWIAFQGPFQLQVNPAAARAGALWQKFFRRAARIRFGDDTVVADIHATFVDTTLGSCGELSEWVNGRTWRLEVDDRLDFLKRWRRGQSVDPSLLGSPEYRAKYDFMKQLVELLHDLGGHEFARQYEWSTCKSQPNCLKRVDTENDPSKGLVAVDFRAGLALLPFLPMSPGDFALIIKGIGRGSLVQFDRGNLTQLERFIEKHHHQFSDMQDLLDELKAAERIYRDSVPDVSHNFLRLLSSRSLWSTILAGKVTGWRIRQIIDENWAQRLAGSSTLTIGAALIGLIPFLGAFVQRILFRPDWRKHYGSMLTSRDYFKRAVQGRIAEKMISWHRVDRVDQTTALRLAGSLRRFLCHWPLSWLPVGVHRFLTDRQYAKDKLDYIFVRPLRLYFRPETREKWLREMVSEGVDEQYLSNEDAGVILSQIKEPFIQKYLKCLAVHICTLPVTQVVSVLLAMIYIGLHPELPPAQAWAIGIGIVALFQVVPVSPGSLVRGLYVVYLVIRERNFKDYHIAVFLGFFKYIGYLAFPIQMAYRYPVLARFMACHWANESVHIVPVFGEKGALLEHWVFRLFYNWPLTLRRRIRKRMALRTLMERRFWHIGVCALAAGGIFWFADFSYLRNSDELPRLIEIWWLVSLVPMFCGALVTLGCGGATLWERIVGAAVCGFLTAVIHSGVSLSLPGDNPILWGEVAANCLWRIFIFAIFSVIGAVIMELKLPDPELKTYSGRQNNVPK
jgi:hypothetical protein